MTTTDESVTVEEVKVARRAWRQAVESRDVDRVLALYAHDGRLLGTLDDGGTPRRQNRQRIREYFETFVARDAIRVQFRQTVTADDIVLVGPGHAVYSGYYDFAFLEGGVPRTAEATFTFVYRREPDGRLRILVHNSGLTPAGIR